jgi:CheY-like chemotaxis protein
MMSEEGSHAKVRGGATLNAISGMLRSGVSCYLSAMPTVLVVEDNSDILGAVSEALAEEGWEVVAALSVDEATTAAQSRRIDVVLSDVLLGNDGTDGTALRDRFASQGLGHLPFAFMTASTREAARLAGELVLRKPFAVSEVVEILNAALSPPEAAPAALATP